MTNTNSMALPIICTRLIWLCSDKNRQLNHVPMIVIIKNHWSVKINTNTSHTQTHTHAEAHRQFTNQKQSLATADIENRK